MKIIETFAVIEAIVRKNIRRLTRSKLSALMIIIGPLIIMILAGVAFDQAKLYGVKIATYAESDNNITQSVIKSIQDRNFKTIPYTDAPSCIESVRNGQSHVCIVFSQKNDRTHLEFHVDYSRLNLVYTLVSTLSSGLQAQSEKISLGLAEDLFDTIGKTSQIISENAKTLDTMYANVVTLNARLDNITRVIDAVNVSVPTLPTNASQTASELKGSSGEIENMQTSVDDQLKEYLTQLNDLDSTVTQVDRELTGWDEDAGSIKANLTDVYARMGCTVKDNVFTKLDSTLIAQKLQQSSDPACAMIYSTREIMDDRTDAIHNATVQVAQLKQQITQAKRDLTNTREGLGDAANTAQTRITEISNGLSQVQAVLVQAKSRSDQLNAMKMSLKTEITSIQQSMSKGLSDLAAFNQSLAQVVDNVGQLAGGDAQGLVQPIDASVKPILSNKNVLDYLFPSLLVFVTMFTGILLAATIVMKEKSSAAYFRNFITPVPPTLFVIGSYVTALSILVVQLVILFLVGSFAFGVSVFANIGPTVLLLFLTCSVFISLGMTIGFFFRSEETTTLVAISVASILLLFSSLIVPIENVKSSLATVLQVSPFVIADSALRVAIIFAEGFTAFWPQLLGLIAYAVLLFALSVFVLRRSLKQI